MRSGPVLVYLLGDELADLQSREYWLKNQAGISVVGKSTSWERARREIRGLAPHVLLSEITLAGRSLFDILEEDPDCLGAVRVAFLSKFWSVLAVQRALQTRGLGFISTRDPIDCLPDGIRRIGHGSPFCSDSLAKQIVIRHGVPEAVEEPGSKPPTMTGKQLQVLQHIATGRSTREIANLMGLSPKAVESRKYRIMKQLDIHDRVQLALHAIREGLVSLDDLV
jgi:DNA-binding NarL/FixJ family response regulator